MIKKKKGEKLKRRKTLIFSTLFILVTTLVTAFILYKIRYRSLTPGMASEEDEMTIFSQRRQLLENTKPTGIIIKYKEDSLKTKQKTETLEKRYGEKARNIAERTLAMEVGDENVEKSIEELKSNPDIEYVEPDYPMQLLYTPNDPFFKRQWWLTTIKAPQAWDITRGRPEVKVGIIDSGVSANHPDISSNISKWLTVTDTGPYDRFGHGTSVAGIIAAITNNNRGVAGTVHNIKITSIKVCDREITTTSNLVQGIRKAADEGLHIVNISIGGYQSPISLEEAVNYALNKGVIIVAAAGNEDTNDKTYPASYPGVISTAATTERDRRAAFSNYGSWVFIAAPGTRIVTTGLGGYEAASGTSVSAPIVTGVTALIKSAFPNYTNNQIRQKLCGSADRVQGTGNLWRCGRVNAYKAVLGASVSPTPRTSPSPTPRTSPSPTPRTSPSPTPQTTPPSTPNPDKSLIFKLRFQGITQKARDQKIEVELYKDTNLVGERENQAVSNDENGIYTFYFENSNNSISPSKYTVRFKGESHLGKKFQDIDIKNTTDTIDLSNQEAKAGDVNGDNKINITDVAQVLVFYISFSNKVNPADSKMVTSDINKDGQITIADVALVALNWSNLTVTGE